MWIFVVLLMTVFSNTFTYAPDDKRELVYLQLETTNGLYTPLKLYPTDTNKEEDFPEELGQLSQHGKIQHYEFGKVLRDYYKDFITSSPTEVDAFSSAEDRSTQSLLCLLASLYAPSEEWEFFPGFHWQPIPVSYLDENDIFFRYPENCVTQLQEKLEQYNSFEWKMILEHDMFFYAFLGNIFSGAKMWTWRGSARLYDTVQKEKFLA
uniref:acid phosphatase n=1 Tax=Latrodectus hesperus TaxID=256737 RepID=E7D1Q5_LATHE|nr:putative lysosomal acid phosphatase [Latrodectus hesperus]